MSIFPTEEEKMDGLRSKINQYEKSIRLLNDFLKSISKEELEKIIHECEKMECTGPTISEYFKSFGYSLYNEVIFVEDKKEGGFTVFFKEIPNVISEGETREEAYHNLILALHDIVMSASNSMNNKKTDV